MIDLLSLAENEIVAVVTDLGFPAFRGRQLYRWCHRKEVFDPEAMSDLPSSLRAALAAKTCFGRGVLTETAVSAAGDTVKFLIRYGDDDVETVLMDYDAANARQRRTLCVSTQVGCAMGCRFCATGQSGLIRDLTAGEIIDQVNFANAYLAQRGMGAVTNVVYMGMGEPLANYDAVLKSVRILNDAKDIGMRRITISTCGLIPQMAQLAAENLQLTLAVSLHGADDETRRKLMPIAKRYPLAELMAAIDAYIAATHRRVTIEYALFDGVNDGQSDALALAELLQGRLCHVNLVPGNAVAATGLSRSPERRIDAFAAVLTGRNIAVSLRASKGGDIDGACGQLRARRQNMKNL